MKKVINEIEGYKYDDVHQNMQEAFKRFQNNYNSEVQMSEKPKLHHEDMRNGRTTLCPRSHAFPREKPTRRR
jgi:hypothetical protein